MDMQMPEMDGVEATRAIRALALAHRPTIVALTANAYASDRAACLEAGMDDFMAKPLRLEELRALLQRVAAPRGITRRGRLRPRLRHLRRLPR
jgi:CheY-like chemotaxis protein